MLITARPGSHRDNLLKSLRSVRDGLFEHSSTNGRTAHKHLVDYLGWANNAVRVLGRQISAADLNELVLTKRHQQLLAGVGSLAGTDTREVVEGLVTLEVEDRIAVFDEAIKSLSSQIERWSRPGVFIVADTTFYIEHDEKFKEATYNKLVKVWEDPIHLLIPMVVVDELDKLKESKKPHVRWRASYTLAVIDRMFPSGTEQARLRPEDFSTIGQGGIPHGEVTAELLLDPPGHVRLPIEDDEIVDRALAAQSLAGRPVKVLTYDTGQSTRARIAGLQDIKLRKPLGDEPVQETAATKKQTN